MLKNKKDWRCIDMAPLKKANKALVTDSKEMEIWELPGKEFKIIILKNSLSCKRTPKQLNKIKKTKHEKNQKFHKEKETIKKNRNFEAEKYDSTKNCPREPHRQT